MMSDGTEELTAGGNERPFPWHCPKCRRREVWRVTVPYEFERRHAGVVKAVRIDSLAVPRCSHCGELVFDYEAHEQIRRATDTLQNETPPVLTDSISPAPTR